MERLHMCSVRVGDVVVEGFMDMAVRGTQWLLSDGGCYYFNVVHSTPPQSNESPNNLHSSLRVVQNRTLN